ncbi:hypothetical protein [Lacinutrix sp. Bg11-31]|uniref:hypothetical protein n=1 Tax=Lacinutrix sp. Bg11-31 TaxID=2057808 RepID=UPI000C30D816|nr:hypothetical protein [Lacinutrix sp. Bg11-31]AUC83360.1 hypothetical protein CW733_14955 [Lacinutrix sp. Bg11-31]
MKNLFLISLLIFTLTIHSQDNNYEIRKSFVIFEGCDDVENNELCYEMKLQDFIVNTLDRKSVEDFITTSKRDTISVFTSIRYDDFGETIRSRTQKNSIIYGLDLKIYELIHEKLPKVKPAVDSSGNTIMMTIKKRLFFKLDRTNNKLIPIYGYRSDEVSFAIIENVPIYPGCDEKLSRSKLRRCMSSKISAHIGSEFNLGLATKLNLPTGYVRIHATFKIDKNGKAIEIQARASHPELKKEAERVLALLPKMIKPGIHKGQPVVVSYSLPIKLAVAGGDKKEKKK